MFNCRWLGESYLKCDFFILAEVGFLFFIDWVLVEMAHVKRILHLEK